MSVYIIAFLGLTPIGSLFAGAVAHWGGAPAALAAGGIAGLLSVLVISLREKVQRVGTE